MKIIKLIDLTEEQFYGLKDCGMLWEFYPEAPDQYRNINREIKQ